MSPVQAAELDALLRARDGRSRDAASSSRTTTRTTRSERAISRRGGAEVIAHARAAARMAKEHPGLIAERRRDPEVAHLFESAAAVRSVANRRPTTTLPRGRRALRSTSSTPATLTRRETSAFTRRRSASSSRETSCRRAITRTWRTRTSPGCARRSSASVSFRSRTLVPGHGPRADARAVEDQIRYLDRRGRSRCDVHLDSGTEEEASRPRWRALSRVSSRNRPSGARRHAFPLVRPHHPGPGGRRSRIRRPDRRKEITRELHQTGSPRLPLLGSQGKAGDRSLQADRARPRISPSPTRPAWPSPAWRSRAIPSSSTNTRERETASPS